MNPQIKKKLRFEHVDFLANEGTTVYPYAYKPGSKLTFMLHRTIAGSFTQNNSRSS